ncbi:MAG: hypothetical protein AAFW73_15220 [Bacteroidota bacterium]
MIKILSRHKLKRIEVMGNPGEGTGKLYDLYNGFQSGRFSNDEEAAREIYQAEPSDRRYRKLKNKLKNRLINTLVFIDANQPRFNEYAIARFNCLKLFTAQQIFNFYRGVRSSEELGSKALKEADKYGFYFIALEITRSLRNRQAIRGTARDLAALNQKIRQYQKVIEAECLAEEYYYSLVATFSRSGASRGELLEDAIRQEKELRPYTEAHNSVMLTYYARNFFALRYILDNDYQRALEECKIAIEQIEERKYYPHIFLFALWFRILQCHLQLKNYHEGERVVQRCLELTATGSVHNHFVTREMHLLLSLHTEQYDRGCDIYFDTIESDRYRLLSDHKKENWRIYGAFIHYLIEIGKVSTRAEEEGQRRRFKLGKFLNEVPTYSKDKRGLNIPILIIQSLFLLHRRRFSEVIDRTEALNTYAYRYLRRDETYRSNCFIKMILTLPAANFHRQAVIRRARKFREKLELEPLEVSGESSEVEIIPYEKLWEMVLDSLDDKFQKPRKPPK